MQTQKYIVREQILSVACKLFLRKGFSGVSMRDISRESGVGLSNIYN
ncbi:MAG: TetR/AcrR family transcriptional regulator [Rikenellaceae bacterium]